MLNVEWVVSEITRGIVQKKRLCTHIHKYTEILNKNSHMREVRDVKNYDCTLIIRINNC